MTKKKHTLLKLAGLAALPIAYYGAGSVLFEKMFKIDKSYIEKDLVDLLPDEFTKNAYVDSLETNIEWFKHSNVKSHVIKSLDGLKLDGIEIANHSSNKYMILVHGYNTDRYVLLEQAHIFSDLGYNILMIDQRGWGNSEGEYTTFGFKESLDLLCWIDYLVQMNHDIEIGLYGVSMGASTVLMTIGQNIPDNVKFAISDSAYTSLSELLSTTLKMSALNPSIAEFIERKLGFNIKEVDCIKALAKASIPTLFIHGDNDKLLPLQMALNLHAACENEKELCVINDCGHAYACYREGFKKAISDFIKTI